MKLNIFFILIAVGLLAGGFCSYNCFSEHRLVSIPVIVSGNESEPVVHEIDYLPGKTGEMVYHRFFTLSYNAAHKQANWVYYSPCIGKEGNEIRRTNDFREDYMVASGSAKPSDYVKSGYDRGHLCPAGDMTQSVEAMSETFYMSNMSPQVPGFNRGIWKSLEEQVRKWGKEEQIHVVTGPIFENEKGKIGESRVTIPGYYYKVIYSPVRKQMIAFVLPNEKSNKKFTDHIVSVDSVENFTGIDFFVHLPDTLENRLEAKSDYMKWQ